MQHIGRREFLRKATIGLLTPYVLLTDAEARRLRRRRPSRRAPAAGAKASGSVFPQSVASGDPTSSGVILWTRINPAARQAGESLAFEVALDPSFVQVVTQGVIDASELRPERDYTVHLDLDGQLAANTVYYYRFQYAGTDSRMGRCRTLPLPGDALAKVCFGVLTCQDYTNGYYGALTHLALDPNVDFVLHLGDFIYETTGGTDFQSLPFPDRGITLPGGRDVTLGLEDYRALYRTYRSDPWLQMAMEYHTWIVIWDDHETANDCYWDYARDTLGAPDHPYQVEAGYGNEPDRLRTLKLEAQQAWSEYIPARPSFDETATHPHDALTIYRRFEFGDLVDLFMTDERTYRSPHPCGEESLGARNLTFDCPGREAPGQTMLGGLQRDWLVNGLTGSTALWKSWGNQVFLGELTAGPPRDHQLVLSTDAWDGYAFERRLILDALRESRTENFVVLTGDLHSYIASYVKRDYADRDNGNPDNVVGVEFMTPALTSANFVEVVGFEPPRSRDRSVGPRPNTGPRFLLEEFVQTTNPHVRLFNGQDVGYSTVEYTRASCTYTAYAVDKAVNQFQPARRVLRRIRVPAGQPQMELLPI